MMVNTNMALGDYLLFLGLGLQIIFVLWSLDGKLKEIIKALGEIKVLLAEGKKVPESQDTVVKAEAPRKAEAPVTHEIPGVLNCRFCHVNWETSVHGIHCPECHRVWVPDQPKVPDISWDDHGHYGPDGRVHEDPPHTDPKVG